MPTPVVPGPIEAYAEAHTTPPTDVLRALAQETESTQAAPGMMVGALEGRFLEMLVFALQPRVVVEIGTFTGYSSISMAAALPPGGRIHTLDMNADTSAVARRYAEDAGVADRIEYHIGPAIESLARLDGPFDLVFIDADKASYRAYYEAALPKLSERGIIAVDNVLWSGRVIDPAEVDTDTEAVRAFNDLIAGDDRVVAVLCTVRDGVTLIRRRAGF